MFILIVLVGLRGVLLYMAKALQRPIEMVIFYLLTYLHDKTEHILI